MVFLGAIHARHMLCHVLGEHAPKTEPEFLQNLVDVFWACFSGLGIGAALGAGTALLMHRLSTRGTYSEFTEDFLGLGLIALSYGLSLLLLGYGFLAVFAAGFMFHRSEMRFGTFAAFWIRKQVTDFIDQNRRSVRTRLVVACRQRQLG